MTTQAQVLPKELRLVAPPTMPQARSYLFRQQSTETSYLEQGTIQINIPRLQRSYLSKDSYLRFTIEFTYAPGAGGAAWDASTVGPTFPVTLDLPGAYGFFDKIEVYDYLGSTLLESTAGHGQLMALLMDTSLSPDELAQHWNTIAGTFGSQSLISDGNQVYWNYNGSHGDIATATADQLTSTEHLEKLVISNQSPYRGEWLISPGASSGTVTLKREFSIPLLSFLGLLSPKYAPLHNGYTIQLTLNSAKRALGVTSYTPVVSSSTPYTGAYELKFTNVGMDCQILELGPQAESMLLSSTQGQPLIVPTKAFRNYTTTVLSSGSTARLDLNLNVASLTNILWFMRRDSTIESFQYPSLSMRFRNFLKSWYFQYGSSVLPQTSGIQCSSTGGQLGDNTEAYMELMKARHNLTQDNHHSSINLYDFSNDDSVYNLVPLKLELDAAKFAGGLDLELVPGKANDLVCGLNTNGMNTSINLEFLPDAVRTQQRLDAYAEYDAFVNIAPGLATTVSF